MPVMVVDDEYLLRSLIIRSIDWQEIGLAVVCEAADGEEALSLIEQHHPAIALVDINMPFMNGLELSKIISEKYPQMQVIILTGYSEFEYAREAIRAKAVNYITKPIDTTELKNALVIASNTIKKQQKSVEQITNLQKEAFVGRIAAKDDYLRRLFNGRISDADDQIAATLRAWDGSFIEDGLVVLIISFDQPDVACNSNLNAIQIQYSIGNIVREIFSETKTCEVSLEIDLTITVLIGFEWVRQEESLIQIQKECNRIVSASELYFKLSPTISIGSCVNQFHLVPVSFHEAIQQLSSRFYRSDRILIRQKDQDIPDPDKQNWPFADMIMIMADLRLGHDEHCLSTIKSIFDNAIVAMIPEYNAKSVAMSLLTICFSILTEKSVSLTGLSFNDMVEQIRSATSIGQLCTLMLNLYARILEYFHSDKSMTKLHPMIQKALTEIEKNYSNPLLSLELIAKSIFISPSYLSSIFKKELGKSMIEYLIEYRMNVARQMILADVRRDIVDIASEVGYRDVYYFSRCFKKYFGVAPTHYWLALSKQP